jgi:hypothetical protein
MGKSHGKIQPVQVCCRDNKSQDQLSAGRVCGSADQLHPIFQDQQHLQRSQRSSRMVPSASSRMAYVRSVSFI